MIIRAKSIFANLPIARFCQTKETFGKKLTKFIISTRNQKDLKMLINKYHGSFNMFNITALLKRVNQTSKSEQLINLAYKQVRTCLDEIKFPTRENSRAIANIIAYAGNQGYHGIDDYIKSIDMFSLFQYVNTKEFVMAFTGICKLNLLDNAIKREQILELLKEYVTDNFEFGLLISLWRNLIKVDRTTPQINQFFAKKLILCEPSHNIKDFGYLIYCYTETYKTFQSAKVLELVQKSSQQILYTTRLNMKQLCVIVDHLVLLSKISQLSPSKQFAEVLVLQYMRIIKSEVLDLRTLANGYLSMHNFVQKVNQKIHAETTNKFLSILQNQTQSVNDFQSITSLFVQIITTRPKNQQIQQGIQKINEEAKKQKIIELCNIILFILYDNKTNRVKQLNDKQFQKMLYGLYLFNKQIKNLLLNDIQKYKTGKSTIQRANLTEVQLNSIKLILNTFEIKDELICKHVKKLTNKFEELKGQSVKKSQAGCLLGYHQSACLKCLII